MTKTTTLTVVPDAEPRYSIVKDGRKWFVVNLEGQRVVTEAFKTKGAAQAEADECNKDLAEQAESWAVNHGLADAEQADADADCFVADEQLDPGKAGPTFVATPAGAKALAAAAEAAAEANAEAVTPATMNRVDRLVAAKAELTAIREAKATGAELPATPVLDWMADADNDAFKAPAAKATRASGHTPEQLEQITTIIRDGRLAGLSWSKVAEALTHSGIPTARGGSQWWDTTAGDLAKRLDLGDLKPVAVA